MSLQLVLESFYKNRASLNQTKKMMDTEDFLHLVNFFFMLITASAPIYIAFSMRRVNRRLLLLSVGLALFALVHGFYHLAEFLDLSILADDFLLPLSVVLLVGYGFYCLRSGV